MNFVRPILNHTRTQPDTAAIVDGDRTISYRELAEIVTRAAGHLVALGVRPGDRVGVCLQDTWHHVVSLLAIGLTGAVITPLDWRARAAENTRVADGLGPKLVLIEPGGTLLSKSPALAVDSSWHGAVDRATPLREGPEDWNAPLLISATSGTTGIPKFTLITHLQTYMRASTAVFNESPRPRRNLSTVPLYFGAGRDGALFALLRGDTLVLHPALFNAAEFVNVVVAQKINLALVVPAVIRQLLQIAGAGGYLLPMMNALKVSGAPLYAEEKRQAARRLTPNFIEEFGVSAIGTVSGLRKGDVAERAESVGQVYPWIDAEIVDERDRAVAPGTVGQLRVRGPGLGSPISISGEPSREFRDGWYYPGEIAAVDDLGYLYIKGRISDVILRGGAKIYPAEIEAVLQAHVAVLEAAVVGFTQTNNEEAVAAFVVANRPVELGQLVAHCRARLAPYKVPQEIRLVGSLPKNMAGKFDKIALAAQLKELALVVETPAAVIGRPRQPQK